eukprot:CAMPEP_0173172340 /NCGR_PEP_ID=MMETSP1141-20130122/2255_1 /TAXON_ID=483371 /ORGANISM="non described non described, Strain CCMP2298" /LENGTH=180 /DNA_ID=CAMNT_0014094367 /DNA_START=163 /DNA_END=704 /DNA_ORIENTATION=+
MNSPEPSGCCTTSATSTFTPAMRMRISESLAILFANTAVQSALVYAQADQALHCLCGGEVRRIVGERYIPEEAAPRQYACNFVLGVGAVRGCAVIAAVGVGAAAEAVGAMGAGGRAGNHFSASVPSTNHTQTHDLAHNHRACVGTRYLSHTPVQDYVRVVAGLARLVHRGVLLEAPQLDP